MIIIVSMSVSIPYATIHGNTLLLNSLPVFSYMHPLMLTYLNGVYYWLSRGLDDIYMIRYLYMGSDQFGEMQVPAIPSEHWGKLTLHGGLLAMLTGDPRKPMTSI